MEREEVGLTLPVDEELQIEELSCEDTPWDCAAYSSSSCCCCC